MNSARGISRPPNEARWAVRCWQSIVSMPRSRQKATSAASAIFEASVRRANIDSPKNIRPSADAVEAAGELAVDPGLDAVHPAGVVPGDVGVDHLGHDPGAATGRRAAPWRRPAITRRNALSIRISQPGVRQRSARIVFRSDRASLNSAGSSTMRGSGDHQSTGWPSLYQGKMPLA